MEYRNVCVRLLLLLEAYRSTWAHKVNITNFLSRKLTFYILFDMDTEVPGTYNKHNMDKIHKS